MTCGMSLFVTVWWLVDMAGWSSSSFSPWGRMALFALLLNDRFVIWCSSKKYMGFSSQRWRKHQKDHSPVPLGAWSKAQLKQIWAKRGSHNSAMVCDFVHQDQEVHFPLRSIKYRTSLVSQHENLHLACNKWWQQKIFLFTIAFLSFHMLPCWLLRL